MAIAQPPSRAARESAAPVPAVDRTTAYAIDVAEGRVVAGELVKKAARRHLRDLERGAARGLRFDVAEAERSIDFYPIAMRHWKGELGPRDGQPGKPVALEPWQQFIVGAAFGWMRWSDEHGRWIRRFRLVYVEVAKKNGKTLLGAGFGLRLAFFDDEPGAEVYSLATKRDQAKFVWNDMREAVRGSAALRRRLRITDTTSNIADPVTASKAEPLGRDSNSDQGINPHGGIIDELHAHKDRGVFDNVETAMASRTQPMRVVLTTSGVKRESIWWEVRSDVVKILDGRADDDSIFGFIATLDEEDDPFDEAVWSKANPNLGVSVQLQTLREDAAKAKRSPGARGAFFRFRMNLPTQQANGAIDIDEWDACEPEIDRDTLTVAEYEARFAERVPPGSIGYGGLDLASVRDLTALVLIFKSGNTYDVLCRFWCPEAGIDERSQADGVPYRRWADEGWLIATPGNVTDYAFVRAEVLRFAEERVIGEIGYDRWNATQLVTELIQEGASCVPISQTHSGLAPGWRDIDKAVLQHTLRHGQHPILRWMAGNVEVETDPQGNQKPSKATSVERIDGMVALDMGMNRWIANGEPQVWTAA